MAWDVLSLLGGVISRHTLGFWFLIKNSLSGDDVSLILAVIVFSIRRSKKHSRVVILCDRGFFIDWLIPSLVRKANTMKSYSRKDERQLTSLERCADKINILISTGFVIK